MLFSLMLSFAGAFALGDALAWCLRANRVVGTVVGVRSRGTRAYWCIYEYTDATGRTVETSSSIGSSSGLADKQTGSTKQLMVFADQLWRARENYVCHFEAAAGLSLIAVGLLMGWPDWLVWALGVAAGLVLARQAFNRRASVARRNGGVSGNVAAPRAASLQRAEDILAASGSVRRNVRSIARIWMVTGLVLLAASIYVGRPIAQLETAGMHAPGDVVAMAMRTSVTRHHLGTVYYAVVRFTTVTGTSVRFEDNEGSNSPRNNVGDKVEVLYLPGTSPVGAIIDRGIGNWLYPVMFGLGAALALALAMRQISLVRSMQGALPAPSLQLQPAVQPMGSQMPPALERSSLPSTDTSGDTGVTPVPPMIEGVTVLKQDPRSASRTRRLGWCFLIGWPLFIASFIVPSPTHYSGAAVLLMLAPALGFLGFFAGQALIAISAVGRVLLHVTGDTSVPEPATADAGQSAAPVPRVLDLMLTAALVLMASGCALIGVGLAAQLYRYFGDFRP